MRPAAGVAFRSLATRALWLTLAMVTGAIVARFLQPEGRGIYAVITTTAGIAMLLGHLSLEKSQLALWSDRTRHPALITNGWVLGLAMGTVAAMAAVIVVAATSMPGEWHLWIWALLAVPFGAAAVNLSSVLVLQDRMDVLNRRTVVCSVGQSLTVALLAAADRITVTNVVICWAVSAALPFFFALHGLRRVPLCWDVSLVRRQFALSGRYHVGWVATYLIASLDVLLLSALQSVTASGLYTVAVTVMTLSRIPGNTITQVVLPRQAASEPDEAKRITAWSFRINLLTSSAVVATLAGASPWLIPLVYGAPFAGSVAPLLALAPGAIAFVQVRLLEQYLVRLDRPTTMTVISLLALTANVLLNLVAIPLWGVMGAAFSSSATYVFMAVLTVSRFTRTTGLPVQTLLPGAADVRLVLRPLLDRRRLARQPE
ncbi:polysaccharide biosynthesis C-terminal domain-containing protein [Nonomuraea sp. NPDC049141]|uniref:lipopolysaccharide biosynthesis protein n=1 Tax=Nonomuraea sp. NPDC049141 TaxID=3155500 RepID=UPI0033E37BA7